MAQIFMVKEKSKKPVVLCVNKVDDLKKYGNDVYEFYNLFTTDDLEIGKTYAFSVCCIDGYEKKTPAESKLLVEVV